MTDDGAELLESDQLQERFEDDVSQSNAEPARPTRRNQEQKFLILDMGRISSFDHHGMLQFMVSQSVLSVRSQ